jgi:hypothetical protein
MNVIAGWLIADLCVPQRAGEAGENVILSCPRDFLTTDYADYADFFMPIRAIRGYLLCAVTCSSETGELESSIADVGIAAILSNT